MSASAPLTVAVLGATSKPTRYAHRAVQALRARGHAPIGVNPALPDLGDVPVVRTVGELPPGVDTLTMYVGPARSAELSGEILSYGFRRVIFNPGAENPALAISLEQRGVKVEVACTLVMLAMGEF